MAQKHEFFCINTHNGESYESCSNLKKISLSTVNKVFMTVNDSRIIVGSLARYINEHKIAATKRWSESQILDHVEE